MEAIIKRLIPTTLILTKEDKTIVSPNITKKKVRTTKAVSSVIMCNS